MCGIVGYIGSKEAYPVLIKGLHRLEYRGYDSSGVAMISDEGKLNIYKAKGKVAALEHFAESKDRSGTVGIAHTRWATHGEPNDTNAHPHASQSGDLAIVHNGTIENYTVVKKALEQHGYAFRSETDTEVVVQLIDYIRTDTGCMLFEAVREACHQIVGAYAIAVIDRRNPNQIVVARKSSPLVIGVGDGEYFIASDATPIVEYTNRVVYLNDDEIAVINRGESLHVFNMDNKESKVNIQKLRMSISELEKGGYPHFMLKEIMEQPRAIKSTLDPRVKDHRVVFDELKMTDAQLMGFNKIMITACGSAFYAGQAGKYALEKLTHIPVDADLASEFRYRDPIVDEHTLMIIISQSGETADTLAALRMAKAKGCRILSIVNVVGSSIARESDDVLYTWAGPEIAVATTKAYSTQMAVLNLLGLYFGEVMGTVDYETYTAMVRDILALPEKLEQVLAQADQIQQIARDFAGRDDVFFIGRNLDYALSMEGSLKLKEISYVHSDAYAAGELKHGTISLITEGVPVIALATQKQVYEKTISNAKETKSRGARVILFTTKDAVVPDSVADYVVRLDDYEELLMPLQLIVPLQLFAYYMAVLRGCDVDKPRNLAKSVTVE